MVTIATWCRHSCTKDTKVKPGMIKDTEVRLGMSTARVQLRLLK